MRGWLHPYFERTLGRFAKLGYDIYKQYLETAAFPYPSSGTSVSRRVQKVQSES